MRRMSVCLIAVAILAAGCATPASPGAPVAQTDENDCAVIAAVAREHYRFGPDNPAPPLWLDDAGSAWAPDCDWGRYGVSFGEIYDPAQTRAPGQRPRWVSFRQPRYDGRGAVIETGVLHGPLAGMGAECRVISGFAGWTVGDCRRTWIS